jgi:predicted ATPase/class 3 adenylate cyclase/DNA-binding CsgD family transcriptional regulator
MIAHPTGTVTFLFTDIENSTRLAREYPETWELTRARHHAILRAAIESSNGFVFQIIGDAFCAAFHKAGDAFKAAVKSQQDLQNEPWREATIYARMGIHTGEAENEGDEYRGYTTLSLVQRVMSAGHGGQILISSATENLLREQLPQGIGLRDMGMQKFAGSTSAVRVFQVIAPDLPREFPPLRTQENLPNNLPTQLTSFIGRKKELADVKKFLQNTRMLTLIGPGGTGKTRLSIQAAGEMLDQYPDGVWFVELAPILDPLLVPRTTAIAIGLRDEPQRPVIDMLCDYLRKKKMLLVLDNCEHLVAACAHIADRILLSAPETRILASSREALGIGGEVTYRVPSLELPNISHLPPIESLRQYEAVRLFIDRAMAAIPSFAVTNDNAPALAQICYHLDGIPLAIELAAAKIRVLSVEQIAKRLDDRFRLLTGGSRTAFERQQTLRATIDWSYNLLLPAEQVFFRRLSVFVGGWTLEAVESVCKGGSVKSEDVLNLMEQLINKSLVMVEEAGHESRYHMLETIRQYANERLVESRESDALRNRHLEFFLQLAMETEPILYGREQVSCLNRLEEELDNFRAALEWSLEEGDAESGLRLATELWRFWVMRDHWSEGYDRLKKALSGGGSMSAATRANALGRAGELANMCFIDSVETHILCTEGLTLCRELEDEESTAFTLYSFGNLFYSQGNYAKGSSLFEESLTIYRKLNDKWGIALVLDMLSHISLMQSNLASARMLREECLAIFRELGDYWDLMRALHNYGEMARFEGDYARAKVLYEEARALGRELGVAKMYLVSQLMGLGYAVLRGGDGRHALTYFREGLILQKEQELTGGAMALCIAGLGAVAAAEGQSVRAAKLLGATMSMLTALEAKGYYLELQDRVEYDRDVMVVRAQLDEAMFNAHWDAGQKMMMDEALDLALKTVEEIPEIKLPSGADIKRNGSLAHLPSQREAEKQKYGGLTTREREVAAQIAQGKSNQAIAAELFISLKTVEANVTHILAKLGFTSRAQIAGWTVAKGLAEAPQDLNTLSGQSS